MSIKKLHLLLKAWKANTAAAYVSANWFEHWFEFFPNPPVNMLSLVENIISHHDKDLLRHLIACDVTTQVCVCVCYMLYLTDGLAVEVLQRNHLLFKAVAT